MNKVYEYIPEFETYDSLDSFMHINGYANRLEEIELLAKDQCWGYRRQAKKKSQEMILEWWNANLDDHGDRNLEYYWGDLTSYTLGFVGLMAIKDDYNHKQVIERSTKLQKEVEEKRSKIN